MQHDVNRCSQRRDDALAFAEELERCERQSGLRTAEGRYECARHGGVEAVEASRVTQDGVARSCSL